MQAALKKYARKAVSALLCGLAVAAAGCHGNPNISGYGIAWVSLTATPGNYTSYVVTIDSVTLIRDDGAQVAAIQTPEIVDFAQLSNIAEMWGSGAIPTGTYTSAIITLDYTNAAIYVMVNGLPQKAEVLDGTTRATPTTYALTVNFDPANPPTITNTYASTSAQLFSIDFDLAASGQVLPGSPPTVLVRPFLTAGVLADDKKPIRVRGPLINSSTGVNSYTVYVRPFYDEANNIGSLSLFSTANTRYTINGNTYVGSKGLDALTLLSAGSTMTAGYTYFVPDYNTANAAYSGTFYLTYVIGASSLEDVYTEGISGDVIARDGNTLTLLGATLFLNTANTFYYCGTGSVSCPGTSTVLLGPGTIVTADDNTTLTGLNYNSIAVGQHITARGICRAGVACSGSGAAVIDSTGTSSQNTGSVRLQSTELWGPLVSSAAGSLVMNLQSINYWPVSDYDFAGNGATTPSPAAFSVTTPSLALPAGTVAGDSVWVDGFVAPFGTAPPDFISVALNNEKSVQLAGTPVGGGTAVPPGPGTQTCGAGSQVCDPASVQVIWTGSATSGTDKPFAPSSSTSVTIDLSNPNYQSGVLTIGPESIDLKSLPASPLIVATQAPTITTPEATTAQVSPFAPRFTFGNPVTATSATAGTTTSGHLTIGSNFPDFIQGIQATMTTANPALQFVARGLYDRTNNTFYATSIDFVL